MNRIIAKIRKTGILLLAAAGLGARLVSAADVIQEETGNRSGEGLQIVSGVKLNETQPKTPSPENGAMLPGMAGPEDAEGMEGAAIIPENPERGDIAGEYGEPVGLDENWEWALNSAIHTGTATLYRAEEGPDGPGRKGITVCVNAGHGCAGGADYQTLSHPDGSPKVTGGTNVEGNVYSTAISTGTVFADGTTEAEANLMTALALKEELLADGYDVLMIREGEDVQLDNIARTVIANHCADLHIAIHFDSTQSDKGVYFCAVPEDWSYRQMEPVSSHYQEHMALGQALTDAFSQNGYALFEGGALPMDLTQTSYSTIPSVDIEIGDTASDHSPEACAGYARALKDGIDRYFQENVTIHSLSAYEDGCVMLACKQPSS